jgi:hypothetical protein
MISILLTKKCAALLLQRYDVGIPVYLVESGQRRRKPFIQTARTNNRFYAATFCVVLPFVLTRMFLYPMPCVTFSPLTHFTFSAVVSHVTSWLPAGLAWTALVSVSSIMRVRESKVWCAIKVVLCWQILGV